MDSEGLRGLIISQDVCTDGASTEFLTRLCLAMRSLVPYSSKTILVDPWMNSRA